MYSLKANRIISVFITLLLAVININAQDALVIENKEYETPNGKLNVYMEELPKGVYKYNFHIKEMTKILPVLEDLGKHTPFGGETAMEFKKILDEVFIPLILSNYPLVGEAIKAREMTTFWLNMRFDDRKEMIVKGFEIYGTTKNLSLAQEIIKEITSDDRLTKLIKQGADKVYEMIPPRKREDLSQNLKKTLDEGKQAYWGNAYIYIDKKRLPEE